MSRWFDQRFDEWVKLDEEKVKLEEEALRIFQLVVAEWQSDPMSVACFDLRIVTRATHIRALLADLEKRIEKIGPL